MPKISVFDLDKTLCRHDTFQAFLLYMLLCHRERWLRAPLLVLAAIAYATRLRDNSWVKTVFLRQIIGGLAKDQVETECGSFLTKAIQPSLADTGLQEIESCKRSGAIVVLATASPDVYVSQLATRLGIEHVVCTGLELDNHGRFTGALLGGNCYGPAKLRRVDEFRAAHGAAWADVTCYSDHVSDLALLSQAGRGYAVNPSSELAKECQRSNIQILHWT